MLLDPFHNLSEMLVLLSDVVLLAQVDEVDNRLGSEEEKRVDVLNLCSKSASDRMKLSIAE